MAKSKPSINSAGRFRFRFGTNKSPTEAPTKRLLDNWLAAFLDWSLPRSESPLSFMVWSGLYALASVSKRNAVFPKSLMGGYEIVPNLYILMVANPGIAKKSTSAGFAETLLFQVPGVNIAPSSISASKLVGHMSTLEDGTMSVISSEFSSFVGVSRESMFELLTDLYDGKLKHDYMTHARSLEKIEKPVLNLIGATTPKWIASQPSEHLIGGGFSSRVVMLYEEQPRQRELYYDHINWSMIEEMEKLLVNDLRYIATLKGTFRHESTKLKEAMREWYKETAGKAQGDDRIQGYLNRKHVHAHKVAMLLSLSERDDFIITRSHFDDALRTLEAIEPNMHKALSAATKNPFSSELEAILAYIREAGKPVEKGKIMARFYHALNMTTLEEILSSLVVMGDVSVDRSGGKARYIAKGNGQQ